MKNKDYFLKDNVSVEKFADKFITFCMQPTRTKTTSYMEDIKDFLNAEAKPTLTKDERVILRNIAPLYKTIERDSDQDILVFSKDGINTHLPYNHLFQFIKERRRIRDKGVIRKTMNILEKINQHSQWEIKYLIGIGFGSHRKYIQVNKQVYNNKFLSKFVWHRIDMTPITEENTR